MLLCEKRESVVGLRVVIVVVDGGVDEGSWRRIQDGETGIRDSQPRARLMAG